MVFKNEAQLKKILLEKCKSALIKAQEQVYQIIERFVQEFYADYTPEMYERTYQLYRSLVKSEIIPTVNGYEAQVYFDLHGFYDTGAKPSLDRVFDAATRGEHGATELRVMSGRIGWNVWYDPIRYLNREAINILENMLIAEGIPIKK